jgi:hypothetical protein
MLLPGRIELTTLGDLLGALYRERVSGALELAEPSGVRHRVLFRAGVVSGVDTPLGCPPLGRVLLDMGVLSPAARRAVELFCVAGSGGPIGVQLVEAAYIDADTLASGLRRQLQHRLDAVARVQSARVMFRPAVSVAAEPVPLSPREFLHGRPRKRSASNARSESTHAPRAAGRAEALAVLGLPLDADLLQVRAAFRRLAGRMHPDTHAAGSVAERRALAERFARASAAYHVLVA